jgi:hypothetical protein
MAERLVGERFGALFDSFERSAFRLETRDTYAVPEEAEAYQRFLAGEPLTLDWFEPWLETIRRIASSGRTMQRVRLVSNPPMDYQRFELAVTPANLDAGEDIRLLTRAVAATLDLPDHDYWLFDDSRLVVMHFTDEGRFLGAEELGSPSDVAAHRNARDRAVAAAVGYWQFVGSSPVAP